MSRSASIDTVIDQLKAKCRSWIEVDDGGSALVIDPHEGRAVTTHYSISHTAAALILDSDAASPDFRTGMSLLDSALTRWPEDSGRPDFHADFNNFALCLIAQHLERSVEHGETVDRIRSIVLSARDSNHYTVNWLPMRVFVNLSRLAWTGDGKYSRRVRRLERLIRAATSSDGLIEDRLPKGRSLSLQYAVASVAGLDLLTRSGRTFPVDQMLVPLVNACDPEGDINYLGRGCNQVFAWGPWLYLLRARGQHEMFTRSMSYLASHLPVMLENDNLMLNTFRGADREFWWDYHYCSVYTAHALLWLVLTKRFTDAEPRPEVMVADAMSGASGLRIVRSPNAFAAVFDGRSEYLAERGPAVANVWTERFGSLVKGAFGPWGGPFGTRHWSPAVLLNYFGLLAATDGRESSVRPLFVPVQAVLEPGNLTLHFTAHSSSAASMNVPLMNAAAAGEILVQADGSAVGLRHAGTAKSQYGEVMLIQSEPRTATHWKVVIPL